MCEFVANGRKYVADVPWTFRYVQLRDLDKEQPVAECWNVEDRSDAVRVPAVELANA